MPTLLKIFRPDPYIIILFGLTVNVLKFHTLLFLFSNKMLIFRAGSHNMLVRMENWEDPDQTASSDLGLCCFSLPFRAGN